jgi:two-component system, response regulator PdtaR
LKATGRSRRNGLIPITFYARPVAVAAAGGNGMAKRKGKLLVVDDEELILEMLSEAFVEAGFEVATARNALDGHATLREHGDIDLVITDVRMPGSVDGLLFSQVVHDQHPDLPIIVISGVTEPDDRDVPRGATFIPKPFKTALLVDEVKLLLRGKN